MTGFTRASSRFRRTLCLLLLVCFAALDSARAQVAPVTDSTANPKADSVLAAFRKAQRQDSLLNAERLSISLRDSINHPRPPRPEQIRADRREHAFAAGAVGLFAFLTFLLYNLRTR